ncbi:MFS transporter [Desulfobacter hydrogenophilus]|uniref:MFS transporter n=1 Tax=Desulfobacter hydrogenophilus TaxID=2291 RepID=A0A328F741_9BACT|nr:MFS transporter [Desulfobacter hydrogenophilus]NDY73924.1 MFS transporter [Desulfobacter hydrogenophilus]QBH12086.1 MFS transporter [Desulfobacter hydrogenophilus]RAM00368.1 MFS transporter [Desulfobacter hydrogenophilus]
MDFFFGLRESVSQAAARILHRGSRAIPSDHKKVFITLFFIIFITVTGVGIVVPLLPIYAHDLGATGLYVAMIFGAFSISRAFLLPWFGSLSDKKGRKPFILAGLLTYMMVAIAFIWASNVEGLIAVRFIQGAGSAMIMPVVQAYVGEICHEGAEGYAMGLFNLSMFLSLSFGPIMGGMVQQAWSLDAAFYCMSVLSALGAVLCLIFLPPLSKEQIRINRRAPASLAVVIRDRELAGLVVFRYAYTACIGIVWCFMPLYAGKTFGLSGGKIGLLVTAGVFVSGALQLPMGYAADRWNRNIMVVVGGMISSAGILYPFWATSFMDLFAGVCIFGLGGGIAMPALTALAVVKGEQRQAQGSVMSILTAAHSLGMFTGSVMAGLAMDFFSLSYAFPCGSLVMALGVLLFPVLYRRNYKHG